MLCGTSSATSVQNVEQNAQAKLSRTQLDDECPLFLPFHFLPGTLWLRWTWTLCLSHPDSNELSRTWATKNSVIILTNLVKLKPSRIPHFLVIWPISKKCNASSAWLPRLLPPSPKQTPFSRPPSQRTQQQPKPQSNPQPLRAKRQPSTPHPTVPTPAR